MAEQAKQQEAKVERPQVRKVLLTEAVIFPGAVGLGGVNASSEVDCEGRAALQRQTSVTLTAHGPVVTYLADAKPPAKEMARAAKLIPWRMVKGVELSPEWKP